MSKITIEDGGTLDVAELLGTLKAAGLSEFEFAVGDVRISGTFKPELPAMAPPRAASKKPTSKEDDEAMWDASGIRPLSDAEIAKLARENGG